MKRIFCLLLVLSLALSLCACGEKGEAGESPAESGGDKAPAVVIPEPQAATETVEGWISTEIEGPDWAASLSGWDTLGDTVYLEAETVDGGLAVAAYDTLSGQWSRTDLDTADAHVPGIDELEVTEGAVWALLREGYTDEEMRSGAYYTRRPAYYLTHVDRATGEQNCRKLDFWQEGKNGYFVAMIGLDGERVLLGNDGDTAWLLDAQGNLVDRPAFSILGMGTHYWIGDQLYLDGYGGPAPLDRETLQTGTPVPELTDQPVYASCLGNFLLVDHEDFSRFDPATGEKTVLFNWLDVALSYRNMHGLNGLENSQGDIYHFTGKLIRISRGQVPVKKTMTMIAFRQADDSQGYRNWTSCPDSVMDAIVRFNNTDPEYRVELDTRVYTDEADKTRLLIELGTGGGADLIDTSRLPSGAVDAKLLVDLLPYIDADGTVSREDFLAAPFNALLKKGALYEFADKVTMLSLAVPQSLYNGQDWTAEEMANLIVSNRQLDLPARETESMWEQGALKAFAWAATAEFMDWESMTCDFDSPVFASWLDLLKWFPSQEKNSMKALLLFPRDLCGELGYGMRASLRGDYALPGFPDSRGTGSYFKRLGSEEAYESTGKNASLGILASGQNRDGAWRFLRTFMQGEEEPYISTGIPLSREAFEKALANELARERDPGLEYDSFNESDAEALRQLVENSKGMVVTDEAVITAITTPVQAFLDGQSTAEEAAQQIQSRLSLYMAERS